jgi:hypothetical protein
MSANMDVVRNNPRLNSDALGPRSPLAQKVRAEGRAFGLGARFPDPEDLSGR